MYDTRKKYIIDIHTRCWIFTGAKNPAGYGNVMYQGRTWKAHRLFYTLLIGGIPDGMVIDHLCRNHSCVNPQHLEVVTHQQNSIRGDCGKHNKIKTHCPQGHPLSGDNLYIYRGERLCLICRHAKDKQWRTTHNRIRRKVI